MDAREPEQGVGSGGTGGSAPRRGRGGRWGRRIGAAAVGVAVLAAGAVVVLGAEPEEEPAPRPAAGAPGSAAALAGLQARARARPRDDGAWAELGAALVARGVRTADAVYYPRAEGALRHSLKVRAAERGNVRALLAMAELDHARGNFAAAGRAAEAVRKRTPDAWETYPLLIDTYGRLGDTKAAARTAEELMERRGGAAALGWTAQTYRDKGWREDAAVLATEAVAAADGGPQKAEQLRRAGELAWERGDVTESLGYYDASLGIERGQGAAVAGRARALAALGRTAEAVKAYKSALVRLPRPEYALELGELLEATTGDGDPQYGVARAQVEWNRRQGVRGNLVLGRLEADHGDAETAVELLREEFSRHPGAEVADALGWALHRTGDDEAALEYARRAVKEGARNALFLYHRGEIERALGEYGAARRHVTEALRVHPAFSPLWAPRARTALDRLGEPVEGGPRNVWGYRAKSPSAGTSGSRATSNGPRRR
ncbi:tetratricopeptide repeat protein [Streptomyces cremeus]|uniref:Tetratricopeptide repeat protein n=1 Tax=Streptomyces cremeus TaxID=66881 RepID=A0ABV5PH19_STRCM